MDIDIERLETDAAYWDDLFSPCTKRIAIETDENGYIAQIATKHPLSGGSFEMISPNNSIKFVERPTKPAAPEWDGDGLPTVGCECEVLHNGRWTKCKVIAHGHDHGEPVAFVQTEFWSATEIDKNFRPIRTKEQRQVEQICDAMRDTDIPLIGENQECLARAILSRYNLEPKDA